MDEMIAAVGEILVHVRRNTMTSVTFKCFKGRSVLLVGGS